MDKYEIGDMVLFDIDKFEIVKRYNPTEDQDYKELKIAKIVNVHKYFKGGIEKISYQLG